MPAPLPPLPAALFPSPLPGLRPRPRRGDSGPPGGESPGVGSPRLPPGRAPAPDGGRQSSCDPRRPGIRVRRPPRSGTPPPLPNSTPPVPLRPPGHARAGPAGEPPSWMRGLPAAPPRLTGSPPGGQEGCAALRPRSARPKTDGCRSRTRRITFPASPSRGITSPAIRGPPPTLWRAQVPVGGGCLGRSIASRSDHIPLITSPETGDPRDGGCGMGM